MYPLPKTFQKHLIVILRWPWSAEPLSMDQTTWPAPSAPGLRMGPRGPTCAWSTRLWLDNSWASSRGEPLTSLPKIANSLFLEDCFLFKMFFFLVLFLIHFSVSLFLVWLIVSIYFFFICLSRISLLGLFLLQSFFPSIFLYFYLLSVLVPLSFLFYNKTFDITYSTGTRLWLNTPGLYPGVTFNKFIENCFQFHKIFSVLFLFYWFEHNYLNGEVVIIVVYVVIKGIKYQGNTLYSLKSKLIILTK